MIWTNCVNRNKSRVQASNKYQIAIRLPKFLTPSCKKWHYTVSETTRYAQSVLCLPEGLLQGKSSP